MLAGAHGEQKAAQFVPPTPAAIAPGERKRSVSPVTPAIGVKPMPIAPVKPRPRTAEEEEERRCDEARAAATELQRRVLAALGAQQAEAQRALTEMQQTTERFLAEQQAAAEELARRAAFDVVPYQLLVRAAFPVATRGPELQSELKRLQLPAWQEAYNLIQATPTTQHEWLDPILAALPADARERAEKLLDQYDALVVGERLETTERADELATLLRTFTHNALLAQQLAAGETVLHAPGPGPRPRQPAEVWTAAQLGYDRLRPLANPAARAAMLSRIVQLQSSLLETATLLVARQSETRLELERLVVANAERARLEERAGEAAQRAQALRICYREMLGDLRELSGRALETIRSFRTQLTALLEALENAYDDACAPPPPPLPPGMLSVLGEQTAVLVAPFEESVAQLLTDGLGPPPTFDDFCAASRPNPAAPKLTPWQTFAVAFGQPKMRALLAAAETGAGKTNFGLAAVVATLLTRMRLPGVELPSAALVLVPNTIFDQWTGQLDRLPTNAMLIPDEADRRQLSVARRGATSASYRTMGWQIAAGSTVFRVVLQASGYSVAPNLLAFLEVGALESKAPGGRRVPDLATADDLLVIVDEFHKYAFVETLPADDYALDVTNATGEVAKARYTELYYLMVQFALNQVRTRRTAKFLALTATPLTYDPDHVEQTLLDSLRALLPFRLALDDPELVALASRLRKGDGGAARPDQPVRLEAKGVDALVGSWLARKPRDQAPDVFLGEQARGYVSYVNYSECAWMPSYGTPCPPARRGARPEVCMFVPPTAAELKAAAAARFAARPLFPFPIVAGSGVTEAQARVAQPTDFVPLIVPPTPREMPRAAAGRKGAGRGGRKTPARRGPEFDPAVALARKTEYEVHAKGATIRRFLESQFPGESALIYAPCNLRSAAQGCLAELVRQVVPERGIVWFWPAEYAKDTRAKRELVRINTEAGVGAARMRQLYAELLAAAKRGAPGAELVRIVAAALPAGVRAILVYGRVMPASIAERVVVPGARAEEEVREVQRLLKEAFAAQGFLPPSERRPFLYLFAQISTGLDVPGPTVLISTVPVSAGSTAAQLLGRIARLSGAGEAFHGRLRAFQTVVVPPDRLGTAGVADEYPELKLAQHYYSIREASNRVLAQTLPRVALDRRWFGPPPARAPELAAAALRARAFQPTLATAIVDAAWMRLTLAIARARELRADVVSHLQELGQLSANRPRAEGEPAQDGELAAAVTQHAFELLDILSPAERQEATPVLVRILSDNAGRGRAADETARKLLARIAQEYLHVGLAPPGGAAPRPPEPPQEERERRLLEAHALRALDTLVEHLPALRLPEAVNGAAEFVHRLDELVETRGPGDLRDVLARLYAVLAAEPAPVPEGAERKRQEGGGGRNVAATLVTAFVQQRRSETPPELQRRAERRVDLLMAQLSTGDIEDLVSAFGVLVRNLPAHFIGERQCRATMPAPPAPPPRPARPAVVPRPAAVEAKRPAAPAPAPARGPAPARPVPPPAPLAVPARPVFPPRPAPPSPSQRQRIRAHLQAW